MMSQVAMSRNGEAFNQKLNGFRDKIDGQNEPEEQLLSNETLEKEE